MTEILQRAGALRRGRVRTPAHRAVAWMHLMAQNGVDGVRAAAFLCSVRRRRTHVLRTLLRLDDRRLAGIGLTRGELEFAFDGSRADAASRCGPIEPSANESGMKPARA